MEIDMSKLTKRAIINSFTELLKDKPFEKITVSDITAECGISRMTFYYHFHDIYDMIDWATKEKLTSVINKNYTYDTWVQNFTNIMKACLVEKAYFTKMIASVDLQIIEQFLHDVAKKFILEIVKEKEARLGVTLDAESEDMICDIYAFSVVGVFLGWMSRGMKEDVDALVGRFRSIVKGSLDTALLQAGKRRED